MLDRSTVAIEPEEPSRRNAFSLRRNSGDDPVATARSAEGAPGTVMAQGPGADIADTTHSTVLCARGEDATLSAGHVVLLLLIAGVFIALRLWRLTSYGLYGDEIFSLRLASANWTESVAVVARDIVHPPLFYMLVKLWIGIGGDSVLWLKLFPALSSIAALVPLFLLCRELKLKPAAIELALGLMAVNAYLVYYSQELRMYSLLLTLT